MDLGGQRVRVLAARQATHLSRATSQARGIDHRYLLEPEAAVAPRAACHRAETGSLSGLLRALLGGPVIDGARSAFVICAKLHGRERLWAIRSERTGPNPYNS